MAEYIENVASQTSKLDWAFPFQRTGAFPLDRSAVFSSLTDAQNYALGVAEGEEAKDERKLGGSSYVGQIISVYEVNGEETSANAYIISPARTLIKLAAASITGDLNAALDELQEDLDALVTRVDDLEDLLSAVSDKANANETAIGEIKSEIGVKAAEGVEASGIYKEIADAKAEATYDDTELSGRVKTIEDDYLKKADKDELVGNIGSAKDEAIAAAKSETESQIKALEEAYLTGEGAADTIDTLNEIASWIADDASGAAKIVKDVKAIQDDYLKGADKTELQDAIDELEGYVGAIPEDAASENVVAYIHEVVDALKIGDYAKASALTELATTVGGISTKADKNAEDIATLQDTVSGIKVPVADGETIVDTEGVLSIGVIPTEKVTGLDDLLASKVAKESSEYNGAQIAHRLLTPQEADKLSKLILNSDGSVTTGQTVAAGDVQGLSEWLTNNRDSIVGLVSTDLASKIDTAAANAESAVKGIIIGDDTLSPVDGNVELPIAALSKLGLVKSSEDENKVKVNEDGTMEVNSLNTNRLVQTEGEELILFGGSATSLK